MFTVMKAALAMFFRAAFLSFPDMAASYFYSREERDAL